MLTDTKCTRLSPKEKERQLTAVRYMLIELRLTHAAAALALGVSERTIERIVQRNNLGEKIREAKQKGIKDSVRYDESLTAFIVYLRIYNKSLYAMIQPMYKQYLKTL